MGLKLAPKKSPQMCPVSVTKKSALVAREGEATRALGFQSWRYPMSVTQPKLGYQVQVRRPRRANDKAVEKTKSLLSASGANLMYAGYPYDPYT